MLTRPWWGDWCRCNHHLVSCICLGAVLRTQSRRTFVADDAFVQLAPLLSPVLPIQIKDNEVTKHLSGEVSGPRSEPETLPCPLALSWA